MVEAEVEHPLTRTARVLIVDDDEVLANYYKDLLDMYGCETTVFNDSLAALEDFKHHLNDYDFVISDIIMPHMTGDQLASEILKIRPEIPIVLCSGYAPHTNKQQLMKLGIKEFLEKPIDSSRLMQLIDEINAC